MISEEQQREIDELNNTVKLGVVLTRLANTTDFKKLLHAYTVEHVLASVPYSLTNPTKHTDTVKAVHLFQTWIDETIAAGINAQITLSNMSEN